MYEGLIEAFNDGGKTNRRSHGDVGVTSEDVTRSSTASDLLPQGTGVKQAAGPTGIAAVDNGMVCDGAAAGSACFLSSAQRGRLNTFWCARVSLAEMRISIALQQLRVDELLKRHDDSSWLTSFLLEAVGAHLITMIGKTVMSTRNGALNPLLDEEVESAMRGEYLRARQQAAIVLLSQVSDTRVGAAVKFGVDSARKRHTASLSPDGAHERRKASNLAFLGAVQQQSGATFQRIRESVPGSLNDAEFVSLFASFDQANHSVETYSIALEEKLARFNASDVTKIGRTNGLQDAHPADPAEVFEAAVVRDTEVVWVKYSTGRVELQFRVQDGPVDPTLAGPKELRAHWMREQPTFGPSFAYGEPRLTGVVPAEFMEAALSRHRQVWGSEPATIEARELKSWWQADRASATASGPVAVSHKQAPTSSADQEPTWTSNRF